MTDSESNVVALESAEEIDAQAASWLVVLGRDDLNPEDIEKFKNWLSQSDRHKRRFFELSETWDELEALKDLKDIAIATPPERSPYRLDVSRRGMMAMAASLGALTVVAGILTYNNRTLLQDGSFATAVGEQEKIELVDGSTVQLNTNSQIDVALTSTQRSIRLTKGEAHFVVAKDRNRPFLVRTESGVVTAVGTAFTVRLRPNSKVEVTVEEGRVALTSLAGPAAEQITSTDQSPPQPFAELTAGQHAVFAERVDQLEQLEASEISRKLSWRQGMLAYSGEPLADVVEDISRYTNVLIEIGDPDLRALPIGGYFNVGDLDALFESLEITFGLTVEHIDDGHVRLSLS